MNTNENMVKKPKKEDEEFVEEDDDYELDDEKEFKTYKENAKKRMIKVMAFIIGGTIVLLLVLYLISLIIGTKYTYSDVEDVLQRAAEAYFKDYPESLPQEEGDIVEIDSSNLVAAEKMKELTEYTGEEIVCTGTVQVEKTSTGYLYTPYLNCGDNYVTTELYKKILSVEDEVTSGDGLYSKEGSYIYRGENVNNYVQLDNRLWRIVKIQSDNSIVLILAEGMDTFQMWDNRYNETRLYESGINSYGISRVYEYLQRIYNDPNKDDKEDILSKKDKTKLVRYNLCVGKKSFTSEDKDNVDECKEVLQDQEIGLLTLSDYIYVSLDPNCKSGSTKSCMNYNYLSASKEWWLVTANEADNSTVFVVDNYGEVKVETAATSSCVRPVIHLNERVISKGGKGTLKNPYKIK